MRNLLLVDDEKPLVDGLKKVLRPWREHWSVDVAVGGRAALEALKSGKRFDAIVSDARMPDVDGEAVLRAAREVQPHAVRLVLSGQVDGKTGHRLASVSHQFLTKPSSAAAIMASVEECCRLRDSLATETVQQLVSSLGPLPVAPKVYHRITELIDSPNTSADEVAKIVSEDLALSAQVLRYVSSAFFGLKRPVGSVREAVVMIGFEPLRELVLLSELFTVTDPLGLLEEIRQRSLFRAQLARLITQGSPVTFLASEASLLAEIGIYALACKRPDEYRAVWQRHRSGAAPLATLEREVFGVTHAELGSVLLGLWGIPQTVVNAVRWHDDLPLEGAELDARTATALTQLLEDEARGHEARPPVDKLAAQLGLENRLALFREFTARWLSGKPDEPGVAA